MMTREWGQKLRQGWEEADLAAPATRALIDNMAQRQVALGTLLSVDWMTWSGFDATRRDLDRRYIPPAVLARHRSMAEALGGPGEDWDLRLPGFGGGEHSGNPRKALEKQLDFCRLLHSAGGLIVGGTDAGGVSMPPPGFSLLRELELLSISNVGAVRGGATRGHSRRPPAICASITISGRSRRVASPISWS